MKYLGQFWNPIPHKDDPTLLAIVGNRENDLRKWRDEIRIDSDSRPVTNPSFCNVPNSFRDHRALQQAGIGIVSWSFAFYDEEGRLG